MIQSNDAPSLPQTSCELGSMRRSAVTNSDLPKIKFNIKYRVSSDGLWLQGKVISRGGKATGQYWHYLNIESDSETKSTSFHEDSYP